MSYTLFAPGLGEIKNRLNTNPECALDNKIYGEILVTAGVDVLRWFDPFFEDLGEYAINELSEIIPQIQAAPKVIDDARSTGLYDWLDTLLKPLDFLRGRYY